LMEISKADQIALDDALVTPANRLKIDLYARVLGLKIITKRSRKETHSSYASGFGADEGTGVSPGVPDAPDYDLDDDISWKSSEDDQDDDDENAEDDQDDDTNDNDESA
ncbi:hypothetical protein Tco_1543292, partial [Tanacetum coccineum]